MKSNSILIQGVIDDIDINKICGPIRPTYQNLYKEVNYQEKNENEGLALSIRQKGLLQPIIIRPRQDNFEVIAGYRRLSACKKLGWKKIACHIVEANDKEVFEISLIENIHRKTMSPIEEANAFKAYVRDFGYGGVSELAAKIGKSPSYITRRIKLLDLHPNLIDSITSSGLPTSIAEELCSIKDKPKQTKLANLVSEGKLSLRETRGILKKVEKEHYDISEEEHFTSDMVDDRLQRVQEILDKSIIVLRIALNRLGTIIGNIDDKNWIIKDLLMQHRSAINTQIDLLIKEKKKLKAKHPSIITAFNS